MEEEEFKKSESKKMSVKMRRGGLVILDKSIDVQQRQHCVKYGFGEQKDQSKESLFY